jgi:hypothetical protein
LFAVKQKAVKKVPVIKPVLLRAKWSLRRRAVQRVAR